MGRRWLRGRRFGWRHSRNGTSWCHYCQQAVAVCLLMRGSTGWMRRGGSIVRFMCRCMAAEGSNQRGRDHEPGRPQACLHGSVFSVCRYCDKSQGFWNELRKKEIVKSVIDQEKMGTRLWPSPAACQESRELRRKFSSFPSRWT